MKAELVRRTTRISVFFRTKIHRYEPATLVNTVCEFTCQTN